MKITVNIGKKHFYTMLLVIVLAFTAIIVSSTEPALNIAVHPLGSIVKSSTDRTPVDANNDHKIDDANNAEVAAIARSVLLPAGYGGFYNTSLGTAILEGNNLTIRGANDIVTVSGLVANGRLSAGSLGILGSVITDTDNGLTLTSRTNTVFANGSLIISGKVGISTSNPPQEALDVNGNIKVNGNINANQLCIGSDCRSEWGKCELIFFRDAGPTGYHPINVPDYCIVDWNNPAPGCKIIIMSSKDNSFATMTRTGIVIAHYYQDRTSSAWVSLRTWTDYNEFGINGDRDDHLILGSRASGTSNDNLLYDDSTRTGGETDSAKWTLYMADKTIAVKVIACQS